MYGRRRWVASVAAAASVVAALGLAGSTWASPADFVRFERCPLAAPGTNQCIHSAISGGKIVLGKKIVPIEKQIVLQGGLTEPSGGVSMMLAASNGVTLSKTPQNVPGGLLGLVPEKEQNYLVKRLIKFFFENSLTGVSLTPELAGSAGEIEFSETNLLEETEVALRLPLMLHIENPFLGKRCYVGSTEAPVWLQLTSGTTAPPGPNTPIEGSAGVNEPLGDSGQITHLNGAELVDNAWEAPAAHGCGGVIAFLVDPVVNNQFGKRVAGNNTARLVGTIDLASAEAVEQCFVNLIC